MITVCEYCGNVINIFYPVGYMFPFFHPFVIRYGKNGNNINLVFSPEVLRVKSHRSTSSKAHLQMPSNSKQLKLKI